MIEAVGCIPREFNVLLLVLPDGNMSGPNQVRRVLEVRINQKVIGRHTHAQEYPQLAGPGKRRVLISTWTLLYHYPSQHPRVNVVYSVRADISIMRLLPQVVRLHTFHCVIRER